MQHHVLPLAALLTAGCATGGPNAPAGADAAPRPDAQLAQPDGSGSPAAFVYGHSATELFRLDPDTLQVTRVGAFAFDTGGGNITDIALDAQGNMTAISLDALFAVDRETAQATHRADLDLQLTSLSYVPVDANDPAGAERLLAANWDGTVYEIHPQDGTITAVGDYGVDGNGKPIGSSGDIVSVRGFGTVATVTVEGSDTDHLAWINPVTFEASILGDTGKDKIFGLGFWGDAIYGFTDNRELLRLDPTTGAATLLETGAVRWWGAGVTTNAPVVF